MQMFRRLLDRLGGHVGQFPVLNFQYRIITKADSLVGRLTIQNRTFEAGGLDAVSAVVEQMRARGDEELDPVLRLPARRRDPPRAVRQRVDPPVDP